MRGMIIAPVAEDEECRQRKEKKKQREEANNQLSSSNLMKTVQVVRSNRIFAAASPDSAAAAPSPSTHRRLSSLDGAADREALAEAIRRNGYLAKLHPALPTIVTILLSLALATPIFYGILALLHAPILRCSTFFVGSAASRAQCLDQFGEECCRCHHDDWTMKIGASLRYSFINAMAPFVLHFSLFVTLNFSVKEQLVMSVTHFLVYFPIMVFDPTAGSAHIFSLFSKVVYILITRGWKDGLYHVTPLAVLAVTAQIWHFILGFLIPLLAETTTVANTIMMLSPLLSSVVLLSLKHSFLLFRRTANPSRYPPLSIYFVAIFSSIWSRTYSFVSLMLEVDRSESTWNVYVSILCTTITDTIARLGGWSYLYKRFIRRQANPKLGHVELCWMSAISVTE